MIDREGLDRAIRYGRLGERVDKFVDAARPCVGISPACDAPPGGRSRFGGRPDVGDDCEWPRREEGPLAFLARIDLSDVPPPPRGETYGLPLPDAGLLQFYADADRQPWGFDPKDAGGARVIHVPDPVRTAEPPPDLDRAFDNPPLALDFRPGWSSPRRRATVQDRSGRGSYCCRIGRLPRPPVFDRQAVTESSPGSRQRPGEIAAIRERPRRGRRTAWGPRAVLGLLRGPRSECEHPGIASRPQAIVFDRVAVVLEADSSEPHVPSGGPSGNRSGRTSQSAALTS